MGPSLGSLEAGSGRPRRGLPYSISPRLATPLTDSPRSILSPGHNPATLRTTGNAPGRAEQPWPLRPGTQPKMAVSEDAPLQLRARHSPVLRACVLRQLQCGGGHRRLMATGSQPPGIWTDGLCPAARQPPRTDCMPSAQQPRSCVYSRAT